MGKAESTPDSTFIDALAVALLVSEKKTQVQIAEILGLSQATVSRLFDKVKQTYLERTFRRELLDDATWELVRQRASRQQLTNALQKLAEDHGQSGPHVYITMVPERATPLERYEAFAADAATTVKGLLLRVRKTVGVAWGNTLWQLSQALRAFAPQRPWRQDDPIRFVPLCGDPLIDSAEMYADRTSSRITSDLSRTVNGDEPHPPWLGLVPAFIPRQNFTRSEARGIDKLVDLVPGYREIFGPRNNAQTGKAPLAGNLDMILTATGAAKHPIGFGNRLLGLAADELQTLSANIVGDISGVLVPKGTKPHPLVEEFTKHWTGLKMDQLQNCARLAFEQKNAQGDRPGVVMLSFGMDRAAIVLEAVRRGLANHLIITAELAQALESELAGKTRT